MYAYDVGVSYRSFWGPKSLALFLPYWKPTLPNDDSSGPYPAIVALASLFIFIDRLKEGPNVTRSIQTNIE